MSNTAIQSDVALHVSDVSKVFKLPHEQITSVKRFVTQGFRKQRSGYEVQQALKDISFDIKKGEFFGIVGRNGSGKSTLLKILAGIYQPTTGNVTTKGKLVPFIELGVGFNPELTGRENVYLNGALLGFTRQEIDDQYDDIVAFAELERFMDQKLKNYSSGMQVRLAFSVATRAQAEILLVDEVLAVGDAAFQRKCFEYFKSLKAKKTTVIFVTHDMSAVREYCDRAILIDKSEIKVEGNPDDVAREYALLFMDESSRPSEKNEKRWGNRKIEFINADASINKDEIVIKASAKVNDSVDKLLFGLHVSSQDGTELVATNNRLLHKPDVIKPRKGSELHFEWRMLNVFNDGNYSLTMTLVDDVTNTLDWYVDIAQFSVRRQERSTTSILPPVDIKVLES